MRCFEIPILSHLAMFRGRPGSLVGVGVVCSVYGAILIKRAVEGDTLMPGTQFTYLPKWVFLTCGLLFQVPLIGAICFLKAFT